MLFFFDNGVDILHPFNFSIHDVGQSMMTGVAFEKISQTWNQREMKHIAMKKVFEKAVPRLKMMKTIAISSALALTWILQTAGKKKAIPLIYNAKLKTKVIAKSETEKGLLPP